MLGYLTLPFLSGMAGLVFHLEGGLVGLDRAELDQVDVERAVEFGLEGRDLAPVGIGAGRRRRRIGVGDVLRDDVHAPRLRAQAGSGDRQRPEEIHWASSSFTLLTCRARSSTK
jgi:hypothetical protein